MLTTRAHARRRPAAGPVCTVLAAVLLALLAGCGGPGTVPLADLAVEMDDYDGRRVTTHGMVVEFEADQAAAEHYVAVQDTDDNRVQLLPTGEAASHVGSMVEVTGEFEFDPGRGRLLHIEDIAAAQ